MPEETRENRVLLFDSIKKKQCIRQIVKYLLFTALSYFLGICGHIFFYSADQFLLYNSVKERLDFELFFQTYGVQFLTTINEKKAFTVIFLLLAFIFFTIYAINNVTNLSGETRITYEYMINDEAKPYKNFIIKFFKYSYPFIVFISIMIFLENFIYGYFSQKYAGCMIAIWVASILWILLRVKINEYGYEKNRYKVILPVVMFFTFPVFTGFSVRDSLIYSSLGLFDNNSTWIYMTYFMLLIYTIGLERYEKWQETDGSSHPLGHVFYFITMAAMFIPIALAAVKISDRQIWDSLICMDWIMLLSLTSFTLMIKHWAEVIKRQEIFSKHGPYINEKTEGEKVRYFIPCDKIKDFLILRLDIIDQTCRLSISMLISYVLLVVVVLNSKYYFFTMFTVPVFIYMFLRMLTNVFLKWGSKNIDSKEGLELSDIIDVTSDFFVYKYFIPGFIILFLILDRGSGDIASKIFFDVYNTNIILAVELILAVIMIISTLFFPYIVIKYYIDTAKVYKNDASSKATKNSQGKNNKKKSKRQSIKKKRSIYLRKATSIESSSIIKAFDAYILILGGSLGISDNPRVALYPVVKVYDKLSDKAKNIWRSIIVTELLIGFILSILFIYLTGSNYQTGLVVFAELFSVFLVIYDSYKVKANLLKSLIEVDGELAKV